MARMRLNCRGIACPKPLVQLSKAIRELGPGDEIEVEATDRNFTVDVKAWAERTGNELVSLREIDDIFTALIKVA